MSRTGHRREQKPHFSNKTAENPGWQTRCLKEFKGKHMKIRVSLISRLRRRLAAFSIMEVTVGLGILGMAMAALFSGFTSGFFTVRMARENLRATQIMLEKVETIRLYSWRQVTNAGFIPTNFTAKYDPVSQTSTSGLVYQGELYIDAVNTNQLGATYAPNMRLVTVKLNWKTGNLERHREFKSYISRYGLQDYVY
jgi:type II secretory pathway pseudopilin PulG